MDTYSGRTMKSRGRSTGFWIVMSLLATLVLFWGYTGLLGLKQRRNKEAVRAYIARMQPILSADPRFKDVRLMGYSCDSVFHPYMPIFGTVPSQADWAALDSLIRTSQPPVDATLRLVMIGADRKKHTVQ